MDPKQRLKFNAEIKQYFSTRPGTAQLNSTEALVVNNIVNGGNSADEENAQMYQHAPPMSMLVDAFKPNERAVKKPKRKRKKKQKTPKKPNAADAEVKPPQSLPTAPLNGDNVEQLKITKKGCKETAKPKKNGKKAAQSQHKTAMELPNAVEMPDLTSPVVALERMAALKEAAAIIDKELQHLTQQDFAVLMAPQPAPPRRLPRRQLKKTFYQLIPNRIFVGNLNRIITHTDLYDTFSLFGKVQKINIFVYNCGSTMGYGFITFESELGAKHALNAGNVVVKGISLNVDQALVKRHIFEGDDTSLIESWKLEEMSHVRTASIAPVGREKVAQEFHKRVMTYGPAP